MLDDIGLICFFKYDLSEFQINNIYNSYSFIDIRNYYL